MTSYLGHCRLDEHDVDPDEYNHRIVPGRWISATCQEREAAFLAGKVLDLSVWSSLTDTNGEFGSPQMFTQWGSRDGSTPLVADLRYLPKTHADSTDDPKPCEHRIYVVDGLASDVTP